MERSFGILKIAAIVAVVIAGACGAEGGALQAIGNRIAASPAASRTVAPTGAPVAAAARFSVETRRRAELERAWHEAVLARCGGPSDSGAPAPQPPAC